MEIAQHIAVIRREGELLVSAAARTDLAAIVPTCPGWQMRDLVRHIGGIHRWAAAHVVDRSLQPVGDYMHLIGAWPDDQVLIDWFRRGHAALVQALEQAEPDLKCWTFLPPPSSLAFWARRQAHETGIHRADSESASGPITAYEPTVAADGIDELLTGFAPRPRTALRADPPRTLHVHVTDVHAEWQVHIQPDRIDVVRAHDLADCTVSGPASDLYLLVWNRCGPTGLEVEGDHGLLDLWRENVHIRWS